MDAEGLWWHGLIEASRGEPQLMMPAAIVQFLGMPMGFLGNDEKAANQWKKDAGWDREGRRKGTRLR